jgi:hypothetical protein
VDVRSSRSPARPLHRSCTATGGCRPGCRGDRSGTDRRRGRCVLPRDGRQDRYQLQSYVEGQAVGERILLARRPGIADIGPDFWLFDAETDHAFALVMQYDDAGHWLGFEHLTEPAGAARLASRLAAVEHHAVPLNVFLTQVTGG